MEYTPHKRIISVKELRQQGRCIGDFLFEQIFNEEAEEMPELFPSHNQVFRVAEIMDEQLPLMRDSVEIEVVVTECYYRFSVYVSKSIDFGKVGSYYFTGNPKRRIFLANLCAISGNDPKSTRRIDWDYANEDRVVTTLEKLEIDYLRNIIDYLS